MTIGVVAVLFTVAPILVPIALIGYVPIAVVNVRNNRARYQLELRAHRAAARSLATSSTS